MRAAAGAQDALAGPVLQPHSRLHVRKNGLRRVRCLQRGGEGGSEQHYRIGASTARSTRAPGCCRRAAAEIAT